MAYVGADGSEVVSGAVDEYAGAQVALVAPPAGLTASVDTAFAFAQKVYHLWLQNNSAMPVGIEFVAAASAGSWQVPAGGALLLDVPVGVVHLYSTAATAVNGTAAGNVVLKGWA
jgi:hypothetical protein